MGSDWVYVVVRDWLSDEQRVWSLPDFLFSIK